MKGEAVMHRAQRQRGKVIPRWAWVLLGLATLLACQTYPDGYPARFVRFQARFFLAMLDWHEREELRPAASRPLKGMFVWQPETRKWVPFARTKEEVRTLPEPLQARLGRFPETYPRVACAPQDPRLCLRIPEMCSPVVELSRDGGRTWQVGWQYPPRRMDFLRRVYFWNRYYRVQLGFPMVTTGLCALDVVWTPDGTAWVAMGHEGLLQFLPPDRWSRHSLWRAEPTPLYLDGVLALMMMAPEWVLFGLVAPLGVLALARTWDPTAFAQARSLLRWWKAIYAAVGLHVLAWVLLLRLAPKRVSTTLFLFPALLCVGTASFGVVAYPPVWTLTVIRLRRGRCGNRMPALGLLLFPGFPFVLTLWAATPWPLTYLETVLLLLVLGAGLVSTCWKDKARGTPRVTLDQEMASEDG